VLLVGVAVYLLGYGALRLTGWFYLEAGHFGGHRFVTSEHAFRFTSGGIPPPGPTKTQRFVHEHVGHVYGPLRDLEAELWN